MNIVKVVGASKKFKKDLKRLVKMKKHKFEIEGFELVEKVVSDDKGTSGRVYVPKSWSKKKVSVVRLE
jgi:hypothetical protein